MPRSLELLPTKKQLEAGRDSLRSNEYPGRVAIMGFGLGCDTVLLAYALMGRSQGSRQRIFVDEGGGSVRTTAPGKTPEEMAATKNAELIYYQALAKRGLTHVVSNGAQTIPVIESVTRGYDLGTALRLAPSVAGVELSKHEPDDPNFTPRITGSVDLRPDAKAPFSLAVIRRNPDNDDSIYSVYGAPSVAALRPGTGYGVQTYSGNGDPLPSFDKPPFPFPLGEGAVDTAERIWEVLNRDNRVALVVQAVDLVSGKLRETAIVNAPPQPQ